MGKYWNGYQWRELADEHVRTEPEAELQPDSEPAKPAVVVEGSRFSRSMKPTRLEPPHTHTFVNDECACGERDD